MASTIHIFTINIENEKDLPETPTEDQAGRWSETGLNNSKITTGPTSSCATTEKILVNHKEKCLQKDVPSSKTTILSQFTKDSKEEFEILKADKYPAEYCTSTNLSACSPENNNKHKATESQLISRDQVTERSSIVLSCETYPISLELQNSTEDCLTYTYELQSSTPERSSDVNCSTRPQNLTQNHLNFTSESSPIGNPIENDRMQSSVPQFSQLLSSSEIVDHGLIGTQNEYYLTQKSNEIILISTMGPPPLYEPTIYYEPPDFYEPPPVYTKFPLESVLVGGITEIDTQEESVFNQVSRFRLELIIFNMIVFLVIFAIYMVAKFKHS